MSLWPMLAAIAVAYLLQTALGVRQVKSFNARFRDMRRRGRVAIGIKKGGFRSGAIVMLGIDGAGTVTEAHRMSGVTVMARFRPVPGVTGRDLATLTPGSFPTPPKAVATAVENARHNYLAVSAGEAIPEPKAPLTRLTSRVGNLFSTFKHHEGVN